MSDIVERLRQEGEDAMRKHLSLGMHKLCEEAASEIERLRKKLKAISDYAYRATLSPEPQQ